MPAVYLVMAVWLAALLAGTVLMSSPAGATAAFAQQTGKACNYCHTTPPALNGAGKKFKANGNKL